MRYQTKTCKNTSKNGTKTAAASKTLAKHRQNTHDNPKNAKKTGSQLGAWRPLKGLKGLKSKHHFSQQAPGRACGITPTTATTLILWFFRPFFKYS